MSELIALSSESLPHSSMQLLKLALLLSLSLHLPPHTTTLSLQLLSLHTTSLSLPLVSVHTNNLLISLYSVTLPSLD